MLRNICEGKRHKVQTPNGAIIESVQEGDMVIQGLPAEGARAAIFKDEDLVSGNLVSVGQLCDAGMKVLFEREKATVLDTNGEGVITAERDGKSGLYSVDLEVKERMGVMFPQKSTSGRKAEFYTACMGSPTTSTIHQAVARGWVKFPGVAAKDFSNLPHSEATAKGHLDKTRQGLDSTKEKISKTHLTEEKDTSTMKIEVEEIDKQLFADLTGRFPYQSDSGMQYLMIMKCSVTGYIHVEPLGSRKSAEFTRAFQEGVNFYTSFGITHKKIKIDNESSGEFRKKLKENNMSVDFVAPNNHRQNPAERDIRTFKNHFIATLCTTDPSFPLSQWDRLLPQAELTLNLMRGSPLQRNLSSWEHLRGPYNYNRNPIAPAGTRVIIHEDPNVRDTWAPHGVPGFYVGPAMEHYRGYVVFVESTKRTRITDSISWHPHDPHRATVADVFIHGAIEALAADVQGLQDSADFVQREVLAHQSKEVRRSKRVRRPNKKYNDSFDGMLGAAVGSYRSALKGDEKLKWEYAADEEFFRLIEETKTMRPIRWRQKPDGRKISYYNPQIKIKVKPGGELEYRVRGTYGGDISDYAGPTAAQTADMVSIKTLLNATVSEGADWMTMDIKDFYLGTPLPHPEYMRIHIDQMPQKSREKYISSGMLKNDYLLFEINKGIYGLAQAGLLAQERLFQILAQNGYTSIMSSNPCIFKHSERDIFFSLVVDDFGVKYKLKQDVEHLLGALQTKYVVKTDWEGSSYVGFDIKHDKLKRVISISMPRYVEDASRKLNRALAKVIHTPLPVQSTLSPDIPLNSQEIKRLQSIIGIVLYYARAVDPTLLTRVSKLSSLQSTGTTTVLEDAERMFEYCMSYPNANIHFHASDMQLICYTDASYLSESKSRSRGGGYFFLGSSDHTTLNGPILCTSIILDAVVSSAAESEYGAAFENAKEAVYIRQTLEALGYKQAPTPMVTDNAFVKSVTNGTCKVKKSKAMDMRYNWLVDRVKQGQFNVMWCEGHKNIADYFTKDLPSCRYRQMREFIVPSIDTRICIANIPIIKKGITEEVVRDDI